VATGFQVRDPARKDTLRNIVSMGPPTYQSKGQLHPRVARVFDLIKPGASFDKSSVSGGQADNIGSRRGVFVPRFQTDHGSGD